MSKLECRGIGVVIDDQVPLSPEETTNDLIADIVNLLQGDGIPLLRYKTIPPESEWPNFENVAFFLIDWYFGGADVDVHDPLTATLRVPDVPMSTTGDKICKFINAVHQKAFAPILIFSNQDDVGIKQSLKNNGIDPDVSGAYVLLQKKQDMIQVDADGNPRLFSEINNWIHTTPTIHLLTTWGRDVLSARNQMFAEFYGKSHNWPSLLWKTYKDDEDDPSQGLSQVMFDNLKARVKCDLPDMPGVGLDDQVLPTLTDVLALTVMLPSDALPKGQLGCGDLFEIAPDDKGARYHLVVSCDCDCVLHRNLKEQEKQQEQKEQEQKKQFIQVLVVSHPIPQNDATIKDRINPDRGYKHKETESYLFPIDGFCFKVSYNTLRLIPLEDFDMNQRKGRVLPPYITDIRQRLAQWNQRVGFPKLPPALFGVKK